MVSAIVKDQFVLSPRVFQRARPRPNSGDEMAFRRSCSPGLHGNAEAFALGAAILEPELDVLWLQFWELLAIRHQVELVSVPGGSK